jgi:hypothetical protein
MMIIETSNGFDKKINIFENRYFGNHLSPFDYSKIIYIQMFLFNEYSKE